jgi:hypothetical protein
MDNKKVNEAIFLSTIAMRSMNVPDEDIYVADLPLKRSMLLHEDTLVPVIIGISNVIGNRLLNLKDYYDCIFPIELEKREESLCFAKIKECDCDNYAPRSIRLLIAMEVIDNIFIPRLDNKIDITNVVKKWRDVLSDLREGQTINVEKFYDDLVVENLNRLSLKNKLNVNN